MGKFDPYKVVLKTLAVGTHTYTYNLDNEYFKKIDSPEVQRGKVVATATVNYNGAEYEILFQLEGVIMIPCDRCLDDMEWAVNQKSKLIVKFGKAYAEESEEIIVIPEDEGEINLAWFLYEFIALSIPVKHVHPPGKCNKLMSVKLKKHTVKSIDEDGGDDYADSGDADSDTLSDDDAFTEQENEPTDPRWDNLKQLIDTN